MANPSRVPKNWSALALLAALAACHAQSPPSDDPDPVFSAADRAVLAQLSPASLPAPPHDASNSHADDPGAAHLGQKLFFDRSLSGALLEGDNDGSPNALGTHGESGKVSCAGCHIAGAGFLDNRSLGFSTPQGNQTQISLAAGWVIRRTPSLLDVGQARLIMWDGRRDSLHSQVFGPLEASNEMNSSRLFAAEQIAKNYPNDYQEVFGQLPPFSDSTRFPPLDAAKTGCDRLASERGAVPICHGRPGDGAEYDGLAPADQDAVTRVVVNAGKAIGAYERLLSCGQGRFDRWVHGEASALSRAEQRGAALFVGKGQCASCHSGPFFTDQQFHNVGLAPATVAVAFNDVGDRGAATGFPQALKDPLNVRGPYSDGDDGRLPSAPGPAQEGAFRTPALRCLERRPSFMHTGQLPTIESVVEFFDRGGHPLGYPGHSELTPIGLGARDRADLAAFLRTLAGPGPAQSLLASP